MTPCKRFHVTGQIILSLHGNGGELQSHDPALGAAFQSGNVGWRQIQSHHLIQKVRALFQRKAQITLTYLGHLSTRGDVAMATADLRA